MDNENMKNNVNSDSISFLGVLPDDPDLLPVTPPSGFIWMVGGSWSGTRESYGLTDVRVCHKGKTLDFMITFADAIALRSLIDQAIESMRKCGADESVFEV